MEIAPAMSSANPPYTTTLVFPRAERPAVKANGTVKPSERPTKILELVNGILDVYDSYMIATCLLMRRVEGLGLLVASETILPSTLKPRKKPEFLDS